MFTRSGERYQSLIGLFIGVRGLVSCKYMREAFCLVAYRGRTLLAVFNNSVEKWV